MRLDGASVGPALFDALVGHLLATRSSPTARHSPGGATAFELAVRAHCQFVASLSQARSLRGDRWGLVLDSSCPAYAPYLQFLFPSARFLFLCCNALDGYRRHLAAARGAATPAAPAAPPRGSVLRPELFCARWCQGMEGFMMGRAQVGGVLVRCEQFMSADVAELEAYLGAKVEPPQGPAADAPLPELEDCDVDAMLRGSERTMVRLGYCVPVRSTNSRAVVSSPSAAGNDRARCVILVPVARYVESICDDALRELERRGYPVRRLYGCSAIDLARSRLATEALAEGFEETMWIDADVAFDAAAVDQLRAHALPIVCAVIPRRKTCGGMAVAPISGDRALTFGVGGGLLEVLYGGTAFLHVRREVYTAVQERLSLPICNEWMGVPVVPFFMPMVEKRGGEFSYLAEDYAFSRRARLCGYKIFADTSVRLGHIGDYVYGIEDAFGEIARYRSYHVRADDVSWPTRVTQLKPL